MAGSMGKDCAANYNCFSIFVRPPIVVRAHLNILITHRDYIVIFKKFLMNAQERVSASTYDNRINLSWNLAVANQLLTLNWLLHARLTQAQKPTTI